MPTSCIERLGAREDTPQSRSLIHGLLRFSIQCSSPLAGVILRLCGITPRGKNWYNCGISSTVGTGVSQIFLTTEIGLSQLDSADGSVEGKILSKAKVILI